MLIMPTTFEDVYNQFIAKIIDYDFLTMTPQEKQILINVKLKSALTKFGAKKRNIEADYVLQEFNRELEDLEIETIAYWLVYEWITPKINNVEMFEHRLNTKEFQGFSEANHLKEMQQIKKDAEGEAFYWRNQINNSPPEMTSSN
jgi:hypothetical protein